VRKEHFTKVTQGGAANVQLVALAVFRVIHVHNLFVAESMSGLDKGNVSLLRSHGPNALGLKATQQIIQTRRNVKKNRLERHRPLGLELT
jgi:hypothetical protein